MRPPTLEPTLAVQHDTGLVVAAAGSGSRFGPGRNKLLQMLDDVPVVCHCLRTFLTVIPARAAVVLTAPGTDNLFRDAFNRHGIPRDVAIASGGSRRQDSVFRGLELLPETAHVAVIQDGARPYSSAALLSDCIASARARGSGIAARPVVDTIKIAAPDGKVISTPDRSTLWAVETPQAFHRRLIQQCYARIIAAGYDVTDDAQALELSGEPVYLVEHREMNAKITYARDLRRT